MKERTIKLIDHVIEGDAESFRKSLLTIVSDKIEERLQEVRNELSRGVLEAVSPDSTKAEAEKIKADAETQALYVDPMMAKEFFLFDVEYKGHTITIKSLGTGIGKPLVSYIDGQRFEIFTDRGIATKESKQAIETMIRKKISKVSDLRKTPDQIKREEQDRIEKERMEKELAKQETVKGKTSSDK